MINFAMLKSFIKPLGFLLLTLAMTAIFSILYHRYGAVQYQAGYAAATSEYKKKEADFIAKASTRALEAGFAAKAFEKEINQTLNEAMKHDKATPLNHSCINDDWLLWYNRLVRERK